MSISAVHSSPAAQNEAAVKAVPRQNPVPQPASIPRDRVNISPQAHAQAVSADKDHDGDH